MFSSVLKHNHLWQLAVTRKVSDLCIVNVLMITWFDKLLVGPSGYILVSVNHVLYYRCVKSFLIRSQFTKGNWLTLSGDGVTEEDVRWFLC